VNEAITYLYLMAPAGADEMGNGAISFPKERGMVTRGRSLLMSSLPLRSAAKSEGRKLLDGSSSDKM